ncbi:MAG: hypothetical protein ACLRYB_18150 [Segatella copri]
MLEEDIQIAQTIQTHPNYMSNSKLNTNKEKKKGNKDKAGTTTTKAVSWRNIKP